MATCRITAATERVVEPTNTVGPIRTRRRANRIAEADLALGGVSHIGSQELAGREPVQEVRVDPGACAVYLNELCADIKGGVW